MVRKLYTVSLEREGQKAVQCVDFNKGSVAGRGGILPGSKEARDAECWNANRLDCSPPRLGKGMHYLPGMNKVSPKQIPASKCHSPPAFCCVP